MICGVIQIGLVEDHRNMPREKETVTLNKITNCLVDLFPF